MKKLIALFFVSIMSVYVTGCKTVKDIIDNDSIIAKTAIQYGTLEYIDESEENYEKVVNYTEKLKDYVEGDRYQALDVLFTKINSDIMKSDLTPAQKLIVRNIVQSTRAYAEVKLEEKGLSLSEYDATALTLISWIQEAAELSQQGVTASQVADKLE